MFVYCRITYLDLWRMQREVYLHWQMTGCNTKLPILDLHFYFLQSVITKTIFFCCLSGQVFREIKLVLHTSTHHCVKWNFKKNRKTTWNACDQHSLQQHTDIIHDTIMHENACNLLIRFGSYTFKHYKSALLWFTIS